MLSAPVNLPKWLAENSHLLKPPVNNYCVYNEDFTVMIVGGPNARTDYHINQTPEWFYQHRGAMILKVVEEEAAAAGGVTTAVAEAAGAGGRGGEGPKFRDIVIREGDMFLLPGNTPHNPVRFADTVGVVIEQRRPAGTLDRMRWYCQRGQDDDGAAASSDSGSACRAVVHEAAFHCTDLGTQIKAAIERFMASEDNRKCPRCGTLADSVPKPGSIKDPNLE